MTVKKPTDGTIQLGQSLMTAADILSPNKAAAINSLLIAACLLASANRSVSQAAMTVTLHESIDSYMGVMRTEISKEL